MKVHDSLQAAMESSDRCILLYQPDRGFAVTDIEGAEFDKLMWRQELWYVMDRFLEPDTFRSMPEETRLVNKLRARAQPWRAEWWKGHGWLSPLDAHQRECAE